MTPSLSLKLLAPAEFKLAGNAGGFEGYCARFSNVDAGGDVIVPGAFKEFAYTKDGKLVVLYQHNQRDPIGKADVSQDSVGLHVRGQLVLDDPVGARAYTLMKAGTLDAMSVGYTVLPNGEVFQGGVRVLSRLKAFEASIVTWGMNELARVETVKAAKSAMDCEDTRELEELLRDTALFPSLRKAKAAANALWPIVTHAQGNDETTPELKAAIDQIYSNHEGLKSSWIKLN